MNPPSVPPPSPPTPRGHNVLDIAVLRRQLDQRRIIDSNIHNLARSMFKPDIEIKFALGARHYFGKVVEVIGTPGRTQVRVINLSTGKQRDLWLTDIVGIVQEA
jgi:hypothetical protein